MTWQCLVSRIMKIAPFVLLLGGLATVIVVKAVGTVMDVRREGVANRLRRIDWKTNLVFLAAVAGLFFIIAIYIWVAQWLGSFCG